MYLNGLTYEMGTHRYVKCELEVICDRLEELMPLKTLCNKHFMVSEKCDSVIKKVIFNNPATIILWKDGTKTVVKCQKGDTYDKEKGFYMCVAKKALGNKGNFNNEFKRWIEE